MPWLCLHQTYARFLGFLGLLPQKAQRTEPCGWASSTQLSSQQFECGRLLVSHSYLHMNGQAIISEVNALFSVVPDRTTREELIIICPEPNCGDKSGNRSVNVKSGKTNCWRCGVGGSFVRWAKSLGYAVEEGETQAVSIDSLESLSDELDKVDRVFMPSSVGVSLPRGFISICQEPDSAYAMLIAKMARRKKLSIEVFSEAGVGFTRDSELWEPYAIFPVYEWGKAVYFQGRTYVDIPGESTKRFPSKREVKFGSACWVYNLDEVRETRASTVVIVESILNVMSLRQEFARRGITGVVPVAVFKHSISSMQERKIMAIRSVKEVCVMYDADATQSAFKESRKFMNRCRFSVAHIPQTPEGRTQDANDNVEFAVDQFLNRQH